MKTLRKIAVIIAVLFLAFGPLLAVLPALANDTVSGEAWEGSTLSLIAPEGFYFSGVDSVYYGNPHSENADGCSTRDILAVSEAFLGKSYGEISATNGVFGDPCPGVYKILRVSLFTMPIIVPTPTPTETATATPEPTQEPTQSPTPTKTPRPRPTTTYTPEPPVITPTPEPTITETPTPTPTVVPTPSITPTEVPTVEPTPTTPAPTEKPTSAPTQSSEPTPEPSQAVIDSTPTPEPSSTPEAPSVEPNAVSALVAGFTAFQNIGNDMSPEVRAKAKKVVISAIIVTQVAQTAMAAAAAGRRKQ